MARVREQKPEKHPDWQSDGSGKYQKGIRYTGSDTSVTIPAFRYLSDDAFRGKEIHEVTFSDMASTRLDGAVPMPGLEQVKKVTCIFREPYGCFLHFDSIMVRMPQVEEIEVRCEAAHQLILWRGVPFLEHTVRLTDLTCNRLTVYGVETDSLPTDRLRLILPGLNPAQADNDSMRAAVLYSYLQEKEAYGKDGEAFEKSMKRNAVRWIPDFLRIHVPDTIPIAIFQAVQPLKSEQYDALLTAANGLQATAFTAAVMEAREKHIDRAKEEEKREKRASYDMEHPFSARNMRADWEWVQLEGKRVMLSTCKIRNAAEIDVPPEVAGKTVVALGPGLFAGMQATRHIYLPETIESIGDGCFMQSGIVEIDLPGSVTKIGVHAFMDCMKLKSFTLPEKMTEVPAGCLEHSGVQTVLLHEGTARIGQGAFRWCVSLEDIALPESIVSLDDGAFAYSGLQKFHLPTKVEHMGFGLWVGCHELKKVHWPEIYPMVPQGAFAHSGVARAILPDTLLQIGNQAFCECRALVAAGPEAGEHGNTGISLPSGLQFLGERAFAECGAIREVRLRETDQPPELGRACFAQSGIEALEVPEGYRRLPGEMMRGCRALRKVMLPSTLEMICDSAFMQSGLKEIQIAEGLREIGRGAFQAANLLEEIRLPGSVEKIGNDAFMQSGLKEIRLAEGLREIGSGAFRGTNLLTEIRLPDSVEKIGAQCFMNSGLVTISFPQGVKQIPDGVVGHCMHLKRIEMASDAECHKRWNAQCHPYRREDTDDGRAVYIMDQGAPRKSKKNKRNRKAAAPYSIDPAVNALQ